MDSYVSCDGAWRERIIRELFPRTRYLLLANKKVCVLQERRVINKTTNIDSTVQYLKEILEPIQERKRYPKIITQPEKFISHRKVIQTFIQTKDKTLIVLPKFFI